MIDSAAAPPWMSRQVDGVILAWLASIAALLAWVLGTPVVLLREQLNDAAVLVARNLRGPRHGRQRRASCGRLARLIDRRDVLAWRCRWRWRRADGRRGAADQSHLLRRADLSEHRTEPGGLAARADVQRRRDRERPAALLERRIQQAAVRLSALCSAWPTASSASGTTPAFVVNAVAMGLAVCFVYLLVVVLFEDRAGGVLRRAAAGAHAGADRLVGDAAVEPSASCACVAALLAAACFMRSQEHGVARRRRRRGGVRDPVSTGVAPDRAGDCAVALAARARGIRAPAAVVGRACCSWCSWPFTSDTWSR